MNTPLLRFNADMHVYIVNCLNCNIWNYYGVIKIKKVTQI